MKGRRNETHQEEYSQRVPVDCFEQRGGRHRTGPRRRRRGSSTIGLCERGSGVQAIALVVVLLVLVESIRPADDLETRAGRIRTLGERRWEKDEVEKQIAKKERRIVRCDPQDVRQVDLRKPPLLSAVIHGQS